MNWREYVHPNVDKKSDLPAQSGVFKVFQHGNGCHAFRFKTDEPIQNWRKDVIAATLLIMNQGSAA